MLYIQVKSFAQVGVTIENHWTHQEKQKLNNKKHHPQVIQAVTEIDSQFYRSRFTS